MTTKLTEAPTIIAEEALDEISGGPHFRNFHGTSFDFQSGCDVVLVKNTGAGEQDGKYFRSADSHGTT